ncbi:MAG: HAD-IIB family hydrolase [Casimicrobiaceae bacterium]
MQPLSALAPHIRSNIVGVLADIDDTLSSEGRMTAAAYCAMEHLRDAGLKMLAITGRPAGWCDHIARMWPVDAVVGENGAFYMLYDARAHRLRTRFAASAEERQVQRERLAAIASSILREVPGCALASDQGYRASDLAIDYCEDVSPLTSAQVEKIATLMRSEGLTAKVSSIHVNGWFGSHDKLSMTRRLFADEFGVDLDTKRERYIFIGDSPNDAPMFGYFPYSVGVANVRKFGGRLDAQPKYVTDSQSGAGFVELTQLLLRSR